jgi:hypothetical protein
VEKSKNKVKESGMFFVSEKRPSTHHVSPRISPRNHHKNTTICTHFFQNTPQNPSKNNETPARAGAPIFLKITPAKTPFSPS